MEGINRQGTGAHEKAGLLKSMAVRAMSEAEYVSTGALSQRQADGHGELHRVNKLSRGTSALVMKRRAIVS